MKMLEVKEVKEVLCKQSEQARAIATLEVIDMTLAAGSTSKGFRTLASGAGSTSKGFRTNK